MKPHAAYNWKLYGGSGDLLDLGTPSREKLVHGQQCEFPDCFSPSVRLVYPALQAQGDDAIVYSNALDRAPTI